MPLPTGDLSFDRRSAKQKVYETVKDWIIEGQFKPGEKVSDVEIAEYFNVSRTPVREALQLLEAQKLVKSYPGRATIVTELESEHIEKWYPPMIALQKLAIELAVKNVTPEFLEILRRRNREFCDSVERKESPMDIFRADKAFHNCILEAAGNEYVADFCNILWIHIQRLEYKFFRDASMSTSIEEHEKMIEALENRDEAKVSELAKVHWERSEEMVRKLETE